MATSPFVTAYRKDTGERVSIPEHWLGHKTLGKPFRKTEPTITAQKAPASGDNPQKEH